MPGTDAQVMALSDLMNDLQSLDRFGRCDDGAFRRLAWSPELRDCIDWLGDTMSAAGMAPAIDAAGNLIGRWGPTTGKAVVVGSHLDTVEAGGRFDGALGVLAGLDAVRRLQADGFAPDRPLWVVAFMDEEGVRFGESMLGSRAFAGVPISASVGEQRDQAGVTLAEAMRRWDRSPEHLDRAAAIDRVGHYLELHVEQGPVLEAMGIDIGLVTAIAGLCGLWVELDGQANHAGTTPLAMRHDPVAAAAEAIAAVTAAATQQDFLATVGRLDVRDGGFNTVAAHCRFSVDLRAPTEPRLAAAKLAVTTALEVVRERHQVAVTTRVVYELPPCPMDDRLVDVLEAAAHDNGATTLRMPSGAGHDAMVLAPRVPAGMLFIPSRDGVSHSSHEYSAPDDIERGAATLTSALRHLLKR